jgi:Superinfection exclusion gene product 17
MTDGDLKVWWIPQVPMKAFEALVPDLATAAAILDVLADYDAFQFENNVKGDYCNTGGLTILRNGEWQDWESEDGEDFDIWRDENLPRIRTNGWGKELKDAA